MMKKVAFIFALGVFAFALSISTALASPPDKTSAFVCPVITQAAVGEHNPMAVPLGASDTFTVTPPLAAAGGDLMVPVMATNMNGAGVPGGPQSQPGDTDYTAIWARP